MAACVAGPALWQAGQAQPAGAQVSPQGSPEGLLAVPAQITRDTYGLFLVDPRQRTICVYAYQAGTRKLQLLASRTYRFDVQLDDWNSSPPPREIQDLVGQQRRLESMSMPADQAPAP
jgi:hypothetical protein